MDNVFMYDGSSAGAVLPVEYDLSMRDDFLSPTLDFLIWSVQVVYA